MHVWRRKYINDAVDTILNTIFGNDEPVSTCLHSQAPQVLAQKGDAGAICASLDIMFLAEDFELCV